MERSVKANTVFAKRLAGKLKELGYWDPTTQKPQVSRFCLENPYLPSYVYRWLKGEVPRAEALLTLAKRLDVEPDWLLGMEKKAVHPIAGGSGALSGGIMASSARYWWWRMDLGPYARWRPDGAACAR
jgi:hypothetical protein